MEQPLEQADLMGCHTAPLCPHSLSWCLIQSCVHNKHLLNERLNRMNEKETNASMDMGFSTIWSFPFWRGREGRKFNTKSHVCFLTWCILLFRKQSLEVSLDRKREPSIYKVHRHTNYLVCTAIYMGTTFSLRTLILPMPHAWSGVLISF